MPKGYTSGDLPTLLNLVTGNFNVEMEQAVLSAMLLDPEAAERLLARCRPTTFWKHHHAVIFEAAASVQRDGRPVDYQTVAHRLREWRAADWFPGKLFPEAEQAESCLDLIGGPEYLTAILYTCPDIAHCLAYAETLNAMALERCRLGAARAVLENDREGERKALAHKDELETAMAGGGMRSVGALDLGRGLDSYFAQDGKDESDRPHFDLHALHTLGGPLVEQKVSLITGDTGEGKTQLAIQALTHWSLLEKYGGHGQPSVYVTPEMDAETQALPRMAQSIAKPMPSQADLVVAAGRIAESPIQIMDRPEATVEEVSAEFRSLARQGSFPKLVVIDHIQELRAAQFDADAERHALAYIAQRLRTLARELDTHILVLSQITVGEDGERRTFGARQIAQKADRVYDIIRPGRTREERQQATECRVVLAKNRDGRAGAAAVLTIDHAGRFGDPPSADYVRGPQHYDGGSRLAWSDE